MATETKITQNQISDKDPMGLITDSAEKASIAVNKLVKDLGVLLPLTQKIFSGGKPTSINEIALQEKALKKLNDEVDRARKIEEMATRQKIQLERLAQAEIRTKKLLNQEVEKEVRATEKLTRAQQRAQSAYFKVQDALTSLSNRYRELAIRKEMGETLSAKEERRLAGLQNAMLKYDGVLKKVDAQMGRHQRNVGNYGSAFNGLSFSMAQLTREAPAFANSMQTGFMAISNNLPIFFDEIQKIKVANKELAESGKPTTSVFKQIGSSIFSLQTLLSVGVTLLTIYGAEMIDWVSTLFQGADATDKIRKANEQLAKTQKEQAEYIAKESNGLAVLLGRIKATNAGSKERNELIKQANSQYGTTLQNMSDEAKFQAQINAELNRYLLFKEYEFKIKKNEAYIEDVLEKKLKAELKLKEKRNQLDAFNEKIKGKEVFAFELKMQSDLQLAYERQANEVEYLQKQYEKFGGRIQDLTKISEEFNYKEVKAVKEKNQAQESYNKNFDAYLKMKQEELDLLSAPTDESGNGGGQLLQERIKLAEQEISLELASRKGDIVETLRIEKEILKTKAEILRLEYDTKILNTTDEREKQLLRLERDLELEKIKTQEKEAQKKYDEENLAVQQKMNEEQAKQIDIQKELATLSKEVMEIAKDYLTNVLEAQIKSIDEQIAMVNKSYSLLEEKAAQGNLKANESIKEQMRLEQELLAIREKKARQIAFINGLSNLGSSFSGGAGSQSLGSIFASLQGFETGTETEIGNYVQPNLKGVGKDNIAVRVHKNERIINEDLSRKIQGHKTSDVINGYVQYHQMLANNSIGANKQIDLSKTNNLLEKISDQKQVEYQIEKVVTSSFDIIRTSQKGNSLEKRITRVRL